MSKPFKDKKIQIYIPELEKNSVGWECVMSYYPLFEKPIWAYYRKLSSEEVFKCGQYIEDYNSMFIINHHKNIRVGMVIKYYDQLCRIVGIDNFEGNKKNIKLIVSRLRLGDHNEDFQAYDSEKLKELLEELKQRPEEAVVL